MTSRHMIAECFGVLAGDPETDVDWRMDYTQQGAEMTTFLTARVKAIAALVAGGVVSYVATAIVNGTVWTTHGVEVAAATAVLTALGVHQAPANKRAADAAKTPRRVRAT